MSRASTVTDLESLYAALNTVLSSCNTALTGKGVTGVEHLSSIPGAISSITTGSAAATAVPKAVNFYDYNGDCLYSYTLAEAKALTVLPALPSHAGLTCQGWNYTLAWISATSVPLDIGAMYTTDDGSNRFTVQLMDANFLAVPICFGQTVDSGVSILWGDGSTAETVSGTGNVTTTHTYGAIGTYTIALTVADGCSLTLGGGSSSTTVIGAASAVYRNTLVRCHIGNGITQISDFAFAYAKGLRSISMPSTITWIGNSAFIQCRGLEFVVIGTGVTGTGNTAFATMSGLLGVSIPANVTAIRYNSFIDCISLRRVTCPGISGVTGSLFSGCDSVSEVILPSGVTLIDTNAFAKCVSLGSLVLPASLATINGYAFSGASNIVLYDFTACTAVPTLSATSAFTGISSTCVIKVPATLYATWIAATNWSTYASQIQSA